MLGASQKLSPKNILHLPTRHLQTTMKTCSVYLSPFDNEESEVQEAGIADALEGAARSWSGCRSSGSSAPALARVQTVQHK